MESFWKCTGTLSSGEIQTFYISAPSIPSYRSVAHRFDLNFSSISIEKLILVSEEELTSINQEIAQLEGLLNGTSSGGFQHNGENITVHRFPDDYDNIQIKLGDLVRIRDRMIVRN